MAKDEDKSNKAPDRSESPQPAKKSKSGKMFAILGVIVAVIGVECIVAYVMLKNTATVIAQETESADSKTEGKAAEKGEHKPAKHEGKEEGKGEGKGGEHDSGSDKDPDDQIEVVLGEFSVTTFQPATNTTLRIEFNLYGTVLAKDEKEFLSALEDNQHRFRDQVLVIVRSAEITDLTDAGLGLVKRKIMEKTNRMIGKPLLRTIIFSDFSFVEQ